ncbi:MAG: hypothetical protein IAF00_06265 [Phycisphaerales bacterium]|nr:hypothetical protein [Phycisphaerales bacterium]
MNILIATVGSNPLPVVVSIRAIEPDRLWLLYTSDVEQITNRISEHLKVKLPNCKILPLEIKDHQKAKSIRATLEEIEEDWPNTKLNYTGGTKLMAVHVHSFWKEKGGKPENASYLGSDGRLYFDDIKESLLEEQLPKLYLADLCQLHFNKNPKSGNEHLNEKKLKLAQEIHRFVCDNNFSIYQDHLPPLYGENSLARLDGYDDKIKCDWNAAKEFNFKKTGAFFKKDLSMLFKIFNLEAKSIEEFSCWLEGNSYHRKNSEQKKKANLSNAKWLYGVWLEVWLADQLKQMITCDGRKIFDEVHQNVSIGDKPDDFEMDVVAVCGYRLFLFSCTVDDNDYLVKSKLFEAGNRAARIGGEHARAAMLCLHEEPQSVLQTVQEERWSGYNTLRLFGLDHIKGGSKPCQVVSGQQPRAVTLQQGVEEWVKS